MKVEMSIKNGNKLHARVVVDGVTYWVGKPSEDPQLIARTLKASKANPKNLTELREVLTKIGLEIQPVTDPVPGSQQRKPRVDATTGQVVLMICRSGWCDWAE